MRNYALFILCLNFLFGSEKPVPVPQDIIPQGVEFCAMASEVSPENDADKLESLKDFKTTLSDLLSSVTVTMPKEYVCFANLLKSIFPIKDDKIDYSQTYGDVKKMLSPLKEAYITLMKSDETYQFFESLKTTPDCFYTYGRLLRNKRAQELKRERSSSRQISDHSKDDCRDFILHFLMGIHSFYDISQKHGYKHNMISLFNSPAYLLLSKPRETFEKYASSNFEKIIFPFCFVDFMLACMNACDGIYQDADKTYNLEGDLNDDMPFIDVLNKISSVNKRFHPQSLVAYFYSQIDDSSLFEK
ncbi:MAG: hypothetical protein NEHIOOID_00103 [Holosporales bacterium]